MKKLTLALMVAVLLLSCAKNEPVNDMVTCDKLAGSWTFRQGILSSLLTDSALVNDIITFHSNGHFNETIVMHDTIFNRYGRWKLESDTLVVTSLDSTRTIARTIRLTAEGVKIGNAKYVPVDSARLWHAMDIVGSWYQIGSTDRSFYQFRDNGMVSHYYNPVTPTVEDVYVWGIEDGVLTMRLDSDTCADHYQIEFINSEYGRWGNELYRRNK